MPQETTYDTKKIILFGILLLLLVAGIGFLIFRKMNPSDTGGPAKNLFPFDGTSVPAGTTGPAATAPSKENPLVNTQLSSGASDRLRIIASYPVTGMYPYQQSRTVSDPRIDEKTGQTIMVTKTVPVNHLLFNAKQNGFLVDAQIEKNLITINQKTDTSVPNSREIWFSNAGNTVSYRSWDQEAKTITTFVGNLPSDTPLTYCQKPFAQILKTGSKGAEVVELQKYINQRLGTSIALDGVYGKKVAGVLEALRKSLVLDQKGGYDQSLIAAINTDCLNINAARAQRASGLQKLSGEFTDAGILRGTVSPDGTSIFFLKPTTEGVVGIVTDAKGKNPRQVFSSSFSEWKPEWVNPTTITMTTLASADVDGYLYFLNPTNGSFQQVLGPVRGLTTKTNPSATTVLFSETKNKRFSLSTYSVASGATTPRDLITLPAKCVWGNDTSLVCAVPGSVSSGQYPDDWYQGTASFKDSFWSLETEKNTTSLLLEPKISLDAVNLLMSQDAGYFYFINKSDGFLWSYRLGDE